MEIIGALTFYCPRNASWAPHLVLEELDLDYELILVDRKSNTQKPAEYMMQSLTDRIPILVFKGEIIF